MKDKNEIEIINGSIIDINQTVNGQNIFVVLDVNNLDVRYGYDLNYKYEYDAKGLFKPCEYSGLVEFEVIGNIYDLISNCKID